jgi:hypothetical protein
MVCVGSTGQGTRPGAWWLDGDGKKKMGVRENGETAGWWGVGVGGGASCRSHPLSLPMHAPAEGGAVDCRGGAGALDAADDEGAAGGRGGHGGRRRRRGGRVGRRRCQRLALRRRDCHLCPVCVLPPGARRLSSGLPGPHLSLKRWRLPGGRRRRFFFARDGFEGVGGVERDKGLSLIESFARVSARKNAARRPSAPPSNQQGQA